MKYAKLKYNDIVDGEGITVSLWTQGCPIHCKGCHNEELWNHEDGQEINRDELIQNIITAIGDNGVNRNFSILGGEPLAPYNYDDVEVIVKAVREAYPNIKIFLWTGYLYENVKDRKIFDYVNTVIDGPFILKQRDITLHLRGSKNQRIINLR